MSDIVLTISDEEIRRLIERAQQSGYASPEAYLRALVEADLSLLPLPVPGNDETLPPPILGDDLIAAIEKADFSAEDVEEMAKAIQQGRRIDHAGW